MHPRPEPGEGRVGAAGTEERGPTYSVCSFGRYWNADLPTDWIGLS